MRLVLHVRLGCGSLSITAPISLLANEFDVWSILLLYLTLFPLICQRSGSVVEFLTRDREAAGSSVTGVTALCPLARHINPSLVLVQPKKTRPTQK